MSVPATGGAARGVVRWLLVALLGVAGVGHFAAVDAFRAQVPPWMPWPEAVILVSGVVELALAGALAFAPRRRRPAVGWVVAAFFVAVLPGNVSQYLTGNRGLRARQRHGPLRAAALPARAGGGRALVDRCVGGMEVAAPGGSARHGVTTTRRAVRPAATSDQAAGARSSGTTSWVTSMRPAAAWRRTVAKTDRRRSSVREVFV